MKNSKLTEEWGRLGKSLEMDEDALRSAISFAQACERVLKKRQKPVPTAEYSATRRKPAAHSR